MPPELRILVVTPLVWNLAEGAGMPSPYRTVSGFRDAGFDVDIVIPSSAGRTESDYHGMRVHTFGVPTFGLTGSFGLFRSALLLSGRGGRGDSLRWKAFLAAVLLGGVRRGLEVARSRRPAVVYGM